MNLGENINNLRKKKGLSQEILAEKINVSRQTISNWELGETFPNTEQLVRLAKVLEVDMDKLVNSKMEYFNNRIDNTEKLIKKNIKINKIIFITLYLIILVSLIIFIVYILNKKDFTSFYDSEYYCYNNDELLNIYLEDSLDNSIYIRVSGYEEKYYAGNTLEDAINNLNVTKKILINEGYICKRDKK